jgi:hypothetical protein
MQNPDDDTICSGKVSPKHQALQQDIQLVRRARN